MLMSIEAVAEALVEHSLTKKSFLMNPGPIHVVIILYCWNKI